MGILFDQYIFPTTDRKVKPPNCPKYKDGYCMYYETKCKNVNYKCELEVKNV